MAFVDDIRVEICVIILHGVLNNWVFRLETLDNNLAILMTAFGATDNLCDELVAALLG